MGLLIKLQNGDTALKSLKFGKDRPGGGDSGQPYIKDPILDNPLPESPDFLLRGGLNAPIDAAEDVVRLTKYMIDLKSPSGLLFIAKQNLLSRVAPKTETSKGIGYAGGALNEGIYTPLSTLAQAGVGFLGIHLNKQGIDPTGLIPSLSINKYNDIVTFDQPSEKNKLVNLSLYSLKDFNGIKGYDLNQGNDVITYGGGPGSILGIGKTHIKYADQRTGINNPLSSINKKYFYDGGLVRLNSDIIIHNDKVTYGLGASKKEGLDDPQIGISEDGTFTALYNYTLPNSTLSKYNPTEQPLSGSNGYQIGLSRPGIEINYNNLLGASKKEGLDDTQTGIDPTTGINYNLYGPTRDNSTLSKYNPTGIPLSGSDGYQIGNSRLIEVNYNNLLGVSKKEGLTEEKTGIKEDGHFDLSSPTVSPFNPEVPYSTLSKNPEKVTSLTIDGEVKSYQANKLFKTPTQKSGSTYFSQIEGKLTEFGRELTSPAQFDETTKTWEAASGGKIIPQYSSSPSLQVDTKVKSSLDDNIAEGLDKSKNKGYLANLNKNKGVNSPYQNSWRVGGFGISNDFRKVNRGKRGFKDQYKDQYYDYITPVDPITSEEKQYIDYKNETTLDNIYYQSGTNKRTSTSLDNPLDLIEFKIGIINPGSPTNVSYMYFRAYIDNFSDSYGSDWSKQTYMGRGEKFFKYNSFDRSISLGFTIVADNYTNLQTMYDQLNKLAASLAPTYTGQGYLAGNLHKLTVGNYVVDQYGILEGMTYEVIEESPWEITPGSQLPMYIRVTGIKFTPIHNFRPEIKWTQGGINSNQHKFINQTPETNSPSSDLSDVDSEQLYTPNNDLQEVRITPNN